MSVVTTSKDPVLFYWRGLGRICRHRKSERSAADVSTISGGLNGNGILQDSHNVLEFESTADSENLALSRTCLKLISPLLQVIDISPTSHTSVRK
ncbi:unnamed protein product [Rodentolepis nana]|uniref:Uncharacterized protein n=1 Tax=Rodentolepis nana TaxID=102285 RepID=A0A0R3TRE7_RODNA|nr:unnamed protein product [Rodentolepis nana]